MKSKLTELSKILMTLHRSLLHFEAHLQEQKENRRFTPHEMLNLSLNDENFRWLKTISDLIVQMDELVDDKELSASEEDFKLFANQAKEVFFPPGNAGPAFHGKIMQAITFNSDLVLHMASLRNFFKSHSI